MPNAPIPHDEPGRLAELERYAILSTPAEDVFDRITSLASRLFRCSIVLLGFVDERRHWFKSRIGVASSEEPRSHSFCAWAILGNDVMVVTDAALDPRFADNPGVGPGGVRFYACAPLISHRGYKLGALCIADTEPRPSGLPAADVEALQNLAALAMNALKARLGARESASNLDSLPPAIALDRELEHSEAQYRNTFANAPLGFVLTHLDGRFIEANAAYRKITGYTDEELRSIQFISLTHPAEIENNWKLFHKLVSEQIESYAIEKRIFDKQGVLHWVRAHAALLRDAAHKAVKVIGLVEEITEAKRAEQRFRFLAESIPDIVWTAAPDGLLDYVNSQGVSYFGAPQTSLLGAGWLAWVHAGDQPSVVKRWTESVESGSAYETEFRLKRGSDSSWRLHLVRASPLIGEGGRVTQWFGTCTDIQDRHQAARQIEEDRRRWRDLLLQTPAAIAVLHGPDHVLEFANPGFEALTDRPMAAIIGKPMREALPELASQVYADLLDNVYQTGTPFHGHEALIQFRAAERGLRDVYVNFVCLPTKDTGGAIDGIFVHIIDVTAMVAARKAIEESEGQFRTLAETIPHLAWMADGAGNIFWYNRRWFDYTGTTLEQMRGWGWEAVHDPIVLPDVLKKWRGALASGLPFEMTFPLKRFDGEFRPFLTRGEPIKDSNGLVVRWFGTNTDIMDQQRTEEQLRRMNRDLEEFSYVASHDLQEPLRMVNIYTQLMLRDHDRSSQKLEIYAGFVSDGVKRMEVLIQDLLTFSRSVHADDSDVKTADLSAALKEAVCVLESRIEETGAVINISALPCTRGDTPQMAHVFQNVLSNALKYRKASVPPQINVTARRAGEEWIISVRDNGIGFEPQYADRIFGLFKRLHKTEYPGTGLGLAICKRIVERYGGHMWADSVPGEGATFYLSLPQASERR